MKKVLLLVLGLLICATLFATNIDVVGNVRMGAFTVKNGGDKDSVFDFEIGNDIYFNGTNDGFSVGIKLDLIDFFLVYIAPVLKFESSGFEAHIAMGCITNLYIEGPVIEMGSSYYFDGKNGVQLAFRFSISGDYSISSFCAGYSFKFR